MAQAQQRFNTQITDQASKLEEPTKEQVNNMKHENLMIHKELKRTQDFNRQLMSELGSFRDTKTAYSPSPKHEIGRQKPTKLFQNSLDGRKTSSTVYNVPLNFYKFPIATNQRKHLSMTLGSEDTGPTTAIRTGRTTNKLKRFKIEDGKLNRSGFKRKRKSVVITLS